MILISILLIIFCCIIIWRASDGFEAASEYLGRNLSEGVRGATINASPSGWDRRGVHMDRVGSPNPPVATHHSRPGPPNGEKPTSLM